MRLFSALKGLFPKRVEARPVAMRFDATFPRGPVASLRAEFPAEGERGAVRFYSKDGASHLAELQYVERGPLGRRYHVARLETPEGPVRLVARDVYPPFRREARFELTPIDRPQAEVTIGRLDRMEKAPGWSPAR